ncbi:hypothetical protein ABZW49_10360 [Nonomuraea wenchangensis]
MTDLTLPFHPRTGLQAIGLLHNGTPIWPVLGGSGEGDAEAETESAEEAAVEENDGAAGAEEGEEKSEESADAEDDKPLGPAGEKALNAEKEKRRAEAAKRRAAEKERDEAKAELDKLRRAAERAAKAKPAVAKAEEVEPEREEIDPEEVRRDAESKAIALANERIIKAEVRASAAGKLNDPKDALKFLDLSKFEVDADGNVDTEEIDDAIVELLKQKPYLAVAQGESKRFKGSGDGGAKPSRPARPKSLGDAVARHYTK